MPSLSNETKNNLMKMTGLSKMQLENWFTNNRKRFLQPLKDHNSLTNIVDLNKNNDFFNPNLLTKEENIPSVLQAPFIDSKAGYLMGNMHPNQMSMQQNYPFSHFDNRYQVAQMPYTNNNQISLGYPSYSYDRFNNLGGDLQMNNKLQMNPNFEINKQTPEDIQRNNVGVNFLPNLNVPMVGYPLYTQGYLGDRMNDNRNAVNNQNYDLLVNRNFNSNNLQSYSYALNPNPNNLNNLVDISSFPPMNRQNNPYANMNLSNPIQNKFYVSFLPETAINQNQALPYSGSGPEKTEEEEEEYPGDHLAENNNI